MYLRRLNTIGLVLAFLFLADFANAADSSAGVLNAPVANTAEALGKKREVLATQIHRLSVADEEADSGDKSHSANREQTITLLRTLDALYAQHQTRLQQRQQLEAQAKEADKELESLDKFGPDEPKPYSFLLLESLKDKLAAEEDHEQAIKADLKSSKQLLQASHDELDDSASDREERAAKHSPSDGQNGDGPTDEFGATRLPSLIARARVALKQIEIELHTLQLTLCQTRQKQLTKKIEVVSKDVQFSAFDRDKQLANLAKIETQTKGRRREAEAHFLQIDSQRQSTLQELDDQKAPRQVVDAASDAWRTAGDVYQTEAVILDQQIENLGMLRRIWKRRYELASGSVDPQKMSRWLDDLDEFVDQLDDMSHSLEHRRETMHEDRTVAVGDGGKQSDESMAKWTSMRQARAEELRDLCETSLDDIKSTKRTLDRYRGELKTKIKATGNWHRILGDSLSSAMDYKLTDDKQSITVGKLLVLLASVVGGMILAYFLSRIIGRRVLPLLGLNRGASSALKSIAFYSLCLLFGVVAFQMLHIPLAAFAFLGGAAAIAVGFGSQDIMNNFMSGIILLSEQPIRVGDVVELNDVQGEVLHIGLRSTRLRTRTNHELIVPNKSLLDEQVTNLTLTDNFVQVFVAVTVDGTVQVQQAKRQMLHIVFFHPLVLKSPRPVVLLKEYDSFYGCMTFEVHFSLQQDNGMKCAMVQSDILEAISELFKAKKEDSTADSSIVPPEESSPGESSIHAESSDISASEDLASGKEPAAINPDDSTALSNLGKLSPLAVLKEIRRSRGLAKSKL